MHNLNDLNHLHIYRALVNVKDAQGKSIFEGKEVTSFSNAEEETVHLVEVRR